MAKAGMRRPDVNNPPSTESNHKQHFAKNDEKPVEELQGKVKTGKKKSKNI